MAPPRQLMRSALPIMAAVALPSIFPKVNADVQTIFRPLRPHARARNPVSEGGASLGRTHRLCPDSGRQLAADGFRLSAVIRRPRVRPCLAVGARHGDAVGGASR